jgi:hypothetical protein
VSTTVRARQHSDAGFGTLPRPFMGRARHEASIVVRCGPDPNQLTFSSRNDAEAFLGGEELARAQSGTGAALAVEVFGSIAPPGCEPVSPEPRTDPYKPGRHSWQSSSHSAIAS